GGKGSPSGCARRRTRVGRIAPESACARRNTHVHTTVGLISQVPSVRNRFDTCKHMHRFQIALCWTRCTASSKCLQQPANRFTTVAPGAHDLLFQLAIGPRRLPPCFAVLQERER